KRQSTRFALIWARFLRLFLETVTLDRDHSGHDQQHRDAGSGCGIPLLGQVDDGPTEKEPKIWFHFMIAPRKRKESCKPLLAALSWGTRRLRDRIRGGW